METGLNENEREVIQRIAAAGPAGISIAELAAVCFRVSCPDIDPDKANSWVRNALRRPVHRGLIHRTERGRYAVGAGSQVEAVAEANPPAAGYAAAEPILSDTTPASPAPAQADSPAVADAAGSSRPARARRPAAEKARPRRPGRRAAPRLNVQDFAQIASADIEFGDLTVLVGPQATGKSLFLEWLKIAFDAPEVVHALKEAGSALDSEGALLDLVFGEGMHTAWRDGQTTVSLNGKQISPATWIKLKAKKDRLPARVFFIPAQRALLLAEGWPAPFMKLNADTPVVARLFSQNLHQRFSGRDSAALFPVERNLKEQYRLLIDRAVFHGGNVELEKQGLRYRLRLVFGEDTRLPFMTWTAGQREFTPLLLGLYHVLTPRKLKKLEEVEWVVVEEPELGLHPQGIAVFMLLVLDLLWRGYRVVVSTHSPLVLDVVWAIRRLAEHKAPWRSLAEAFALESAGAVQKVLEHALEASYRVYSFDLDEASHKVTARDISNLDPDSAVPSEAEWGGRIGLSARFGAAVRRAENDAEE